jgi:hypothetical protein
MRKEIAELGTDTITPEQAEAVYEGAYSVLQSRCAVRVRGDEIGIEILVEDLERRAVGCWAMRRSNALPLPENVWRSIGKNCARLAQDAFNRAQSQSDTGNANALHSRG